MVVPSSNPVKRTKPTPPQFTQGFQNKGMAVLLLGLGFGILVFSGLPLYKRLILKEERKYQKGELIDGVTTRDFTAEEIEQNKKNSIVVKLFGEK